MNKYYLVLAQRDEVKFNTFWSGSIADLVNKLSKQRAVLIRYWTISEDEYIELSEK